MRRRHLLILGGTGESRRLATRLADDASWDVTTSLAGRVSRPGELPGRVRVGGFGGAEGLARWLREHRVDGVVDATHPFALTMTEHAASACATTGVRLLRLERPAWEPTERDDWRHVDTVADAAGLADSLGSCLLVTTGRQEASAFAGVRARCLLRSIELPAGPLPAGREILLERGPFTLESERALIAAKGVDVVVTKNSGGGATAAKLVAAREAGLCVVVVRRPPRPKGLTVAADEDEALTWLQTESARRQRSNTSKVTP